MFKQGPLAIRVNDYQRWAGILRPFLLQRVNVPGVLTTKLLNEEKGNWLCPVILPTNRLEKFHQAIRRNKS